MMPDKQHTGTNQNIRTPERKAEFILHESMQTINLFKEDTHFRILFHDASVLILV